jgi:uncharacterized protein involved in exopolysaccharide biosynthesis
MLHEWKTILLFVLFFAILGVVSVFVRTKEYKTDVILAPETSDSDLSGLVDSFGNLIGGSFGKNSSDAIYPELYPNIFSSTTFLIDLFDVPVVAQKGEISSNYYSYLKIAYKPGITAYPKIWLTKFLALFKEKEVNTGGLNPFFLTKEQTNICNLMRKNIQCVVDQRTSLITVSVTDVDNVVAATIADTVTARLQRYIVDYRTKKIRNDLEYLEKMYSQAEKEYYETQAEYVKFADANMNIARASQQARLDTLNNEMQLKLNLYSSMAQQLQLARHRLQERTPVFSVMQPAVVPRLPSAPKRMFMLISIVFLTFFGHVAWLMVEKQVKETVKQQRLAINEEALTKKDK